MDAKTKNYMVVLGRYNTSLESFVIKPLCYSEQVIIYSCHQKIRRVNLTQSRYVKRYTLSFYKEKEMVGGRSITYLGNTFLKINISSAHLHTHNVFMLRFEIYIYSLLLPLPKKRNHLRISSSQFWVGLSLCD